MSAYVVFVRDRITDPEEFKTYGQMAPLAREGHEMKALAFYGASKTLEGPTVDGSVIIEFPSMDAAQAWYDSPLYQDALVHRLKGAEYRVFIVEGVPTPGTQQITDLKTFDFATIANGDHFYLGKREFMVTDKGARTLVGVEIDDKARAGQSLLQNGLFQRGKVSGVSEQEVEAMKAASFDDGEILEIVAHVAANTFTNYMNEVFKTDVDFPKVDRQAA